MKEFSNELLTLALADIFLAGYSETVDRLKQIGVHPDNPIFQRLAEMKEEKLELMRMIESYDPQ